MIQSRSDTWRTYTEAMAAKSGQWRIVKTSGGYGVLKSVNGSKVTKSTVVKPLAADRAPRVQSSTKIGR